MHLHLENGYTKKHTFKQSVCMKCEIKLYTRNIASEHILFGAESLNRPK